MYQGSVNGRMVELYGTGIRGRSSLEAVTCTIGGVTVPVVYAGPQGGYPGLDQVNLELPASLVGADLSSVVLTVDGISAAPISVSLV